MTPTDSENTTARDPITVAAQMMLGVYDSETDLRVTQAALIADAAGAASVCDFARPHSIARAFLLALIDPRHPDLDYLRADPAEGAKAREARAGRLLDGRTWDQMPGVAHG